MGIDKSRILIKLASTEGSRRGGAGKRRDSLQPDAVVLFRQARACAEAGVFLISPFVGRIYDWYQARQPLDPYVVDEDPG